MDHDFVARADGFCRECSKPPRAHGEPMLDAAAGEAAAERGMALAEVGKPGLALVFDLAVRAAAKKHAVFCADQVWDEIGQVPASKGAASALGPAFRRAAHAGVIQATGEFRLSERPVAHRKPLPLWRSAVNRGDAG